MHIWRYLLSLNTTSVTQSPIYDARFLCKSLEVLSVDLVTFLNTKCQLSRQVKAATDYQTLWTYVLMMMITLAG